MVIVIGCRRKNGIGKTGALRKHLNLLLQQAFVARAGNGVDDINKAACHALDEQAQMYRCKRMKLIQAACVFLPMDQQTGKYIVIAGGLIILVGLVVYLFADKLHWIGRLPGDIRVEQENFRFYFPVTTMVLLSLVLTLLINLVRKLL